MGGGLHRKAFTLIELLVVIAIIGILATIILTAVNSTRNRAKVANIQATLRNAQTAGEIYYNSNNFTYAGICGDWTTPNTYEGGPLADIIASLQNLDSNIKVGCWVAQTPIIGDGNQQGSIYDASGALVGNVPNYPAMLARQDWALTVYYNHNNYSVNPQGVVTFDTNNVHQNDVGQTGWIGGDRTSWTNATAVCSTLGKRLASLAQLRALRMAHGDSSPSGNDDFNFTASSYWSGLSAPGGAWRVNLGNGHVGVSDGGNGYVRCVS